MTIESLAVFRDLMVLSTITAENLQATLADMRRGACFWTLQESMWCWADAQCKSFSTCRKPSHGRAEQLLPPSGDLLAAAGGAALVKALLSTAQYLPATAACLRCGALVAL